MAENGRELKNIRPPRECVQQWRVDQDYILGLELSEDGNILFASSGYGMSMFDVRYVSWGACCNRRLPSLGIITTEGEGGGEGSSHDGIIIAVMARQRHGKCPDMPNWTSRGTSS
jgi:hypothetical protein